jgi:hypothetical protein
MLFFRVHSVDAFAFMGADKRGELRNMHGNFTEIKYEETQEIRFSFAVVGIVLFLFTLSITGEVLAPASSPNINYYGRFDFSHANQAWFSWSGAAIEATFSGPSISVGLDDGNNDYDVEIDGAVQANPIRTTSATKYAVSATLGAGLHTIRLTLRTENEFSGKSSIFTGFYLADGTALSTPTVKPVRKMEFCGDSHTVGYGDESSSRTCSDLRSVTNTRKSWAWDVARAFYAQADIEAWSGIGLCRNYADPGKRNTAQATYQYVFPRTFGEQKPTPVWDFTKYIPDVVCIDLGTNDYSTAPAPDDSMYINSYRALIAMVLGHYPNASIVMVSSHMTGGASSQDQLLAKIKLQEATAGHAKVYTVGYPSGLALNGCDWHPTVADQRKIADSVIAGIRSSIGWDTGSATITASISQSRNPPHAQKIMITAENGCVIITAQHESMQGRVTIIDCSGRLVARGVFDRTATFVWKTSHTAPGVYLIGNNSAGWTRVSLAAPSVIMR